jgi:hypothetical protein
VANQSVLFTFSVLPLERWAPASLLVNGLKEENRKGVRHRHSTIALERERNWVMVLAEGTD